MAEVLIRHVYLSFAVTFVGGCSVALQLLQTIANKHDVWKFQPNAASQWSVA